MKYYRCPICAKSDWIISYFPRRICKCAVCNIYIAVQDLQVDLLLEILADCGNYYRGSIPLHIWQICNPNL